MLVFLFLLNEKYSLPVTFKECNTDRQATRTKINREVSWVMSGHKSLTSKSKSSLKSCIFRQVKLQNSDRAKRKYKLRWLKSTSLLITVKQNHQTTWMLLSTGLAFHPSFMYLPAPCVEHDKWLFAALVFFPVKLLILRFCETSQMMMWFPSCSGAPRAEAGWKEGWGGGRGEWMCGCFCFWGTSPLTLSLPRATGLE